MALTKVPSNLDATVATTQAASDNSTKVATTAYVTTAIDNLVDSSPAALNTLNELAAALNDDASFSTTVTNSIATKVPLAGGTMTGDLVINANLQVGNSTEIGMDSSGNGHIEIQSAGYKGAIALDDTAMRIYHNSASRNLVLGTNETASITLNGSDQSATFAGNVICNDVKAAGTGGLSFQTDEGTKRIFINDNGRIAMGSATTTSANNLTLHDASSTEIDLDCSGGKNFRLQSTNASALSIIDKDASNANRFTIDSSGNIGIGNASPAQALEIYRNSSSGSAGGYAGLSLRNDHSSGYMALQFHEGSTLRGDILFQNGDDDMQFRVGGGGTERMRITSDGKVGIGTAALSATPQCQFEVLGQANSGIAHLSHFGTNANSSGYTGGITLGYRENNAGYRKCGIITQALGDGAARMHLYLCNDTAADSNSLAVSDAKISINGLSGVTTIGNTSGLTNYYALNVVTTNGYGQQGSHNSSYYHHDTDRPYYYFNKRCEASGGFHTYSDERLKEEITPVTNALDSVAKMNGVTFKWKNADERGGGFGGKHFGVIAQNMLEVDPELPELNKDPLYNIKDGVQESDEYYTMDYSRLSPYFIEAIKELKEKNEALEARIKELEG